MSGYDDKWKGLCWESLFSTLRDGEPKCGKDNVIRWCQASIMSSADDVKHASLWRISMRCDMVILSHYQCRHASSSSPNKKAVKSHIAIPQPSKI
ncbi:hypothetical protein VNO77_33936 [Canavalia gladiata]|uniref:Uncharacterized protein n=1 Tax=Canavalia gladiata TaxID=3824 RepID=A0AAN9KDD2_CANGL